MNKARIYQPTRNAMQSGKAKDAWLLEFVPAKNPFFTDNLMGWTGMTDMTQEIRMYFPTPEAAASYAKREGIPYEVVQPKKAQQTRKAYADNFTFNKVKG